MIQRKQTLFLLQLAFLSISLLFVPIQFINDATNTIGLTLLPLKDANYQSSTGHFGAIALNMAGIILALVTIFLFKRRELQVRLCYILMLIYLVLIAMIALCPFVTSIKEGFATKTNIFAYIICAVCVLSAFLAARFIKKDIELLKSTERIR